MDLLSVLGYVLLPMVGTVIGGFVATLRQPSPEARSSVQHFAAGVIFAVATVELLPLVVESLSPLETAISFSIGVGLMFGLRWINRFLGLESESQQGQSTALLFGVGLDILVDGLLLGIGFALGETIGRLLTAAMTLEGITLGIAIGQGVPRRQALVSAVGLGLLFPIGGLVGTALLSELPEQVIALGLAFAVGALLYLVTEELLVEAHKVPEIETPAIAALFFVGFLLFLILSMVT